MEICVSTGMWNREIVVVSSGCMPECLMIFTGKCDVDKAIIQTLRELCMATTCKLVLHAIQSHLELLTYPF